MSDGLEFDRVNLSVQGLSEEVVNTLLNSRKSSTSKIYSRVWKVFQKWALEKKIVPKKCSIPNILQFLQDGFSKGLKPNTLKVHLSALSAMLSLNLANNPLIKRFFKAVSRLRPRIKEVLAPWDLNIVLSALAEKPFEPLQDIKFKYLTWKTAFLVAISSARRVGELQALAVGPPYTQIFPDKVILKTLPFFRPKVSSASNINSQIVLPSFSSDSQLNLQSLDVRRCLLEYIDKSKEFRKSEHLFVLFAGKRKGCKASKPTIASWVKNAISCSYDSVGKDPPPQLKAHSTRSISTSWAERSAIDVQEICKAATWSNVHTFATHYRLDLAAKHDSAYGSSVLESASMRQFPPPTG
ncbi:hypothetical protein XENTR_v10012388 [Xenopus tropicalis]|nr:hypothetical protein XENTR_v10012388 [Xenopus tropicalis]